jgi:enoyl-[acyl-carrier-protein] reductase (NADH)
MELFLLNRNEQQVVLSNDAVAYSLTAPALSPDDRELPVALRDALSRFCCRQYAKDGTRVNAVAPCIVDTPMQQDAPKDFLKTLQPLGGISEVADIVDAVVYLTEAKQVTGEVLHVDGGAHVGRW